MFNTQTARKSIARSDRIPPENTADISASQNEMITLIHLEFALIDNLSYSGIIRLASGKFTCQVNEPFVLARYPLVPKKTFSSPAP